MMKVRVLASVKLDATTSYRQGEQVEIDPEMARKYPQIFQPIELEQILVAQKAAEPVQSAAARYEAHMKQRESLRAQEDATARAQVAELERQALAAAELAQAARNQLGGESGQESDQESDQESGQESEPTPEPSIPPHRRKRG